MKSNLPDFRNALAMTNLKGSKMKNLKINFVVITLIVLGAACGTNNDTPNNTSFGSTGDADSTLTPTATATLSSPTNTPVAVEESGNADELPPLSYEEMLDAGIESGEWTKEEGLLIFLKYFVGEISDQEIAGADEVTIKSGSGIVALAEEMLAQPDTDSQTRSEIEHLLRIIFPPQDVLDAISRPEDKAGANSSIKLAALVNPSPLTQSEEDCINLVTGGYDPAEIEGQICLFYRERVVTTNTSVRVYFPIWTEDSEEIFATINTLLNTLEESAITYNRYNGLTLKDFSLLYFPDELFNITTFTKIENYSDSCIMTSNLTPNISELNQQVIAQEMFNCVLKWSFGYAFHWWGYGSSLYFSNVVFPQGDLEWNVIQYFDVKSVDLSIARMRFENFVFFQFLGNVYGPQTVVDILESIKNESFDWISYIVPGKPGDFTRFVVNYLSEGIADENTGAAFISPSPPRVSDTIKIDEMGVVTIHTTGDLVAYRYFVDYAKEKRFLQTDQGGSAYKISAVELDQHQNLSAWSGLPPEIRSSCKEEARYIFVPPVAWEDDDTSIEVTKVEKAVCDPCLLGAWKIDNLSFSQYMEGIFEENVPQTENFQALIAGDYFFQFDTEGNFQAKREDLSVYYAIGDIAIQPPLDPEAPGPQPTQMFNVPVGGTVVINSNGIGKYSADGEIMKVTQFVDVLEDAKSGVIVTNGEGNFFGIMGQVDSTFAPDDVNKNESAHYTCEGDVLTISMPYYDFDLVLNRVEKILPTPIPTPSPNDNP
jgi:hypothetical protein